MLELAEELDGEHSEIPGVDAGIQEPTMEPPHSGDPDMEEAVRSLPEDLQDFEELARQAQFWTAVPPERGAPSPFSLDTAVSSPTQLGQGLHPSSAEDTHTPLVLSSFSPEPHASPSGDAEQNHPGFSSAENALPAQSSPTQASRPRNQLPARQTREEDGGAG